MAIYTKEELYSITRRLYRLFQNHPEMFTLRKLRVNVATYDYETCEIELDYRHEMIPGIIHEALHHWFPDWSETAVEEAESNIVNQLSIRQIKNIIKKFGEIL